MSKATNLYRVIVYQDSLDGPISHIAKVLTSNEYESEKSAYAAAREYEYSVGSQCGYNHVEFQVWDRLTETWFTA